jgi:hypothetical protein
MPALSAASEQCFSTFGVIHFKLQNGLGPDRVKKLVYIKINGVQLSTSANADNESNNDDHSSSGSDSREN